MSDNNRPPTTSDQVNDTTAGKRSGLARFFSRSKSKPSPVQNDENTSTAEQASPVTVQEGLDKSRTSLLGKIGGVFKGSFDLDDDLFDDLEEALISSDISVDASLALVENLRARVKTEKIQDAHGVIQGLRTEVADMLKPAEQDWAVFNQRPYVLLMVGVNGVGKTTTIAKIAKQFQDQGRSVMLAAGDAFSAAAVEQLQEWGRRMDIPVVRLTRFDDRHGRAFAYTIRLNGTIAKNKPRAG